MFHIVLAADNNYIKYAAVLISSIVKSTDTNKNFKDFFSCDNELGNYKKSYFDTLNEEEQSEGYIFHILSEDICLENKNKLEKLVLDLSHFYPCKIQIHKINTDFKQMGLLGWGEGKNFVAYYRILIPSLLKEYKTCLYLDVDMLVLKDLRELFSLDLQDYALATVQNQDPFSYFYNSGFLLFNLNFWREQNLQEQCLNYLKNHPKTFDQGALNAVIKNENTLKLPLKYNFWLQTFNSDDFEIFTYEDFKTFKEETYIIHYIRPKPWRSFMTWLVHSKNRVFRYQNIIDLWWEQALKTPVFAKELKEKKMKLNDEFSLSMSSHLNKLEYSIKEKDVKISNFQNQIKGFEVQIKDKENQIKNHLSYQLGSALIKACKTPLGGGRLSNSSFTMCLG